MDFSAILAANRTPESEHPVRPQIWVLILIVLILMVVAVLVLQPPTDTTTALEPTPTPEVSSRIYTVTFRFGVFSPTNLRIHAGDTVRFRNDGTSGVRIVADPLPGHHLPEFDSIGPVPSDGTFAYTFATAGTYTYRNASNSNQTGVIIVR